MTPLRILLAALLACIVVGTPGLGLETRTSSSLLVGLLWGIPFLAAIAALVCTWRWQGALRWLARIAAGSTIVLSGLDLAGLLDPVRPPTAMVIVEVVAIVVSLATLYRTRASIVARA